MSELIQIDERVNKAIDIVKEMEELSGYPILLNTSFNFKDQTITLYPEDAIIRFLDSEMDYLVLGNFFVSKK